MPSSVSTAVVCGAGINAHTIVRNLGRLGWTGRIVLLRPSSEAAGFADCVNPRVEHWIVAIDSPAMLPALIEERYGREGGVAVLFTDERWHPAFAAWQAAHPDSALRVYLGSTQWMPVVLDRYEFCRFIETRGLAAVPRTLQGDEDPWAAFGESFILRPRYSWYGVAQRERVKRVRGRAEHATVLEGFRRRGLQASDLSYQEVLSIRNQDNVSVCGWYGATEQYLFCSRKVLQYPPETGGGDLVELIDPPALVMAQAQAILAALSYEGPFEMEFVFDTQTDAFKVTELNPRFWLQHGLIEAVSGCALVSMYLGRPPLPTTEAERALRYWVNPLYTVYRAFRLDFRSLRHFVSSRTWAPFTMTEAARYAWQYVLDKAADVRNEWKLRLTQGTRA